MNQNHETSGRAPCVCDKNGVALGIRHLRLPPLRPKPSLRCAVGVCVPIQFTRCAQKDGLRNNRSMPQQTPPRCFVDAMARLLIRPLHSSVKGKACKKRRSQKTRSSCRRSHLLRSCCASLKKNHPDLKERLRAFLLIFQHRRKHLTGEGVSASSMRSQSFLKAFARLRRRKISRPKGIEKNSDRRWE